VVVGALCASVSAWSQVLAGFDFPLWLQFVFTVLTGMTAGAVALGASQAAAPLQKTSGVASIRNRRIDATPAKVRHGRRRTCPGKILFALGMLLISWSTRQVVPNLAAMPERVSPRLTV
jgi:hypothetical protein